MEKSVAAIPSSRAERIAVVFLVAAVAFNLWGVSRGWHSRLLPGNEYRQTHTAITALFVQQEHNFSLAYPTPLLGKPWPVPYEFPLYQWSVVGLSNLTGMPLIQAARTVSAICFYLALPAVWLLVRRLGLDRWACNLVLALVLTCPLYIFYARAFLIETMALMFSLWFLASYCAAVERRSPGWLIAAVVAGTGAGLVKVMTFMLYLIPAGIWTALLLWRHWRAGATAATGWSGFRRTLAWVIGGTAIPFAATWGWIKYADYVKAQNLDARSLLSAAMMPYHFGTWHTRLEPEIWLTHWRTISTNLAPVPVLALFAACALFFGGRWRKWLLAAIALFLAAPAIFPILYAWHEYYFVANGVLLLAAIGLALTGLVERVGGRWIGWVVVAGFLLAQGWWYGRFFYPTQRIVGPGGSGLTELLHDATPSNSVLVIAGEDWSPVIPFYAERRALMFRRNRDRDLYYVHQALINLQGESLGAVLLSGETRSNRQFLEEAAAKLGVQTEPVANWRDIALYVRPDQRRNIIEQIQSTSYGEVALTETAVAEAAALRARILTVRDMPAKQQQLFAPLTRQPIRFSGDFAPATIELETGAVFGAHPNSRLWFPVLRGHRRVTMEFGILPGAYENLSHGEATDGVEFSIQLESKSTGRHMLFQRLLNPRDDREARGLQTITVDCEAAEGDELILTTGPGPQGSLSRDWAYWRAIRIE